MKRNQGVWFKKTRFTLQAVGSLANLLKVVLFFRWALAASTSCWLPTFETQTLDCTRLVSAFTLPHLPLYRNMKPQALKDPKSRVPTSNHWKLPDLC